MRGMAAPAAAVLLSAALLASAGRIALAQSTAPLAGAAPAAEAAQVVLRPDQIALIERTLDQAETQGFAHDAFTPAGVDPHRLGQPQLVAALLRYAHDVHSGRLQPSDFLYEWGLRPAAYDPAPEFSQAVAQDKLGAWLDSLPPPYTGYDTLKRGLAAYRGIAAHGGWPSLSSGSLAQGARGAGVVALRSRLAIEDSALAPSGDLYDTGLQQAVMRAQKRYGLVASGDLDKATIAALNVPASER